MKTNILNLVFKTQEEAQKILDENDPGFSIKVFGTGSVCIYDEHGFLVKKHDHLGLNFDPNIGINYEVKF